MITTALVLSTLQVPPIKDELTPRLKPQGVIIFTPEKPDFDKEILAPLRAKQEHQKQLLEAEQEKQRVQQATVIAERAQQAVYRPPVASPVRSTPIVKPKLYIAPQSGLIGSYGYARPGGNCVLEPGINNPRSGNPSSWLATSINPWIGATALFTWNHAGVVTGIWGNGDLEIRHQNCPGCPSRYARSFFRGFR